MKLRIVNLIKFRDAVSEIVQRYLVFSAKQHALRVETNAQSIRHALRDECKAAGARNPDSKFQSLSWAPRHTFLKGSKP